MDVTKIPVDIRANAAANYASLPDGIRNVMPEDEFTAIFYSFQKDAKMKFKNANRISFLVGAAVIIFLLIVGRGPDYFWIAGASGIAVTFLLRSILYKIAEKRHHDEFTPKLTSIVLSRINENN